jgi:hypothetical protein
MLTQSRRVKVTLIITLLALFIYVSYVVRGSYLIFFEYLANSQTAVDYVTFLGPAFWASHIGITARFIGVLMGLVSVFLLWKKAWPFKRVKAFVAAAIILESISFLGLVPSLWILLNPSSRLFTPTLGYGYLLQIIFVVPLLLVLAFKVSKYQENVQKIKLLRVAVIAFVGYTAALVTNEVSRWVSMISLESLQFIEGYRALGLFNAVVFMPFAIVFAVIAAWRLFTQRFEIAQRWLGASLVVIGLNYCIYLGFAFSINALNTLPVVDIWTIPLVTLGAALILGSFRKRNILNMSAKDSIT